MNKIKLNNFDINNFLNEANLSIENHILFANFVHDAEKFPNEKNGYFIDENFTEYQKIWFDLEIINALALDDWETNGKNINWLSQWEEKYKNDAMEVIATLHKFFNKN